MTKYFCDHCGKEIQYSEAVKLDIRGVGACYRRFDNTILLHEECVSRALGESIYQQLLTSKLEHEERKKARQKERESNG